MRCVQSSNNENSANHHRDRTINISNFNLFLSLTFNIFAFDVIILNMEKELNRIKVVLVETKHTGKWLSEQLGISACSVSRWCSNKVQPDLSTLDKISKLLGVEMTDLIKNN